MAPTSVLLLVLLGCSCSLAMISLTTQCPKVETSNNATCEDTCSLNADCLPDHWCCPNACGTASCALVTAPCSEDGQAYDHHRNMIYPTDVNANRCGFCWCQNGEKQCYTHTCDNTGPIP